MKIQKLTPKHAFTLVETVIAIGVLAVLLTGFMYVFTPAAEGIKRSINIQAADRLASTLEQELVIKRENQGPTSAKTGFDKAYEWIKNSNQSGEAIMVYQYRGSLTALRPDGSPEPVATLKDKLPGEDFKLQTMLRRKSEPYFKDDLPAVEGSVYYVKCKQLVYKNGELEISKNPQTIVDTAGSASSGPDEYPEAVIAFAAEFYSLTNKNPNSFDAALDKAFAKTSYKPMFTRNLAVRR